MAEQKFNFEPVFDFEPLQAPKHSAALDTVQKTAELGGTVFGGIAGTAAGALTSPATGPVGPLVGGIAGAGLGRALGTQVGETIKRYAGESDTPSLKDQFKQVGESAVQGGKDQATGEAVGAVASPVISKLGDLVNSGLAKLSQWKLGASVPAKAAEIAKAKKFDVPAATQEEIETGVEHVQNALSEAKNKAGAVLNKAKADIGIPTSVKAREASLLEHGNVHGLGKDVINSETGKYLEASTPEELAANIAKFKKLNEAGNSDPALQARVANALQDKINQFVDWHKTGSVTEGILKQQHKDLGDIVADNAVGLRGAKGEMSKVLNVFDDLKGKLNDGAGKAETFLRGLFTKDTPTNREYLDKLAQLEHMTGKPVLSKLFEQFAGESFSQVAGSPKLASAATVEGARMLWHGNLPGAAGAGVYLAAQSPLAIKMAGQGAAKTTEALGKAVASKAFKPSVIAGLQTLRDNAALKSLKDKLHAK